MSDQPYFFGYGSLVNLTTHDYPDARPAVLQGWKRVWKHTDLRPVTFLSATRAPGAEIDGIIAQVPGADWAALDKREWAYDRVIVSDQIRHDMATAPDIAVYEVPGRVETAAKQDYPIILSYLDIVVQGYLRVFGVERFFETTDGWDTPILNDRAAPRYPRAGVLSDAERDVVDQNLRTLSATVKEMDQT